MVLERNGIEEVKGDEEGEQVLLSLEVLSFHSGSCELLPSVGHWLELTYGSFRCPSA